jgi:hypothetical protein
MLVLFLKGNIINVFIMMQPPYIGQWTDLERKVTGHVFSIFTHNSLSGLYVYTTQ